MADYMDHDFTQYGDFGDAVAPETDNAMDLSTIPYQDRADYQAEQAPQNDPQLKQLAEYYKLSAPSHQSTILDEEKFKYPAADLSSIPYQQRADYQAEQLAPSSQKATHKNTTVSNLMSQLGSVLPQASADEMPPSAPQTPAIDPMVERQAQLDAAQADQRDRLADSTLRGASTDALNAALMGWGVKERLTPGYADQRLNEQTGLKLKDLDQQMKLSGAVNAEEAAKLELADSAALNDPNSPQTMALRQGMKAYFGDRVSDDTISKMSGQQLSRLNKELGGVFDKMDARAQQDKQFKLRMDEMNDARADRNQRTAERREDKEKAQEEKDSLNLLKSLDNLPKTSAAYKRYQEIQPSVEYAKAIRNGEIAPDGGSDGALALQAIKIAQGDASVVRTSDLEQFNKIGGLAQVIADAKQAIAGGTKLRPEVQRAFINIILDSEKGIRRAAKSQTLGKYKELKASKINPDHWEGTLKYIHETEDSTKSNKSYAPDVLNYAKTHGISPEQAQAVKERRSK